MTNKTIELKMDVRTRASRYIKRTHNGKLSQMGMWLPLLLVLTNAVATCLNLYLGHLQPNIHIIKSNCTFNCMSPATPIICWRKTAKNLIKFVQGLNTLLIKTTTTAGRINF